MGPFNAIVAREFEDTVTYQREQVTLADLSQGSVLIKVAYSDVNYKDMLALSAHGGVVRHYPFIPGIDLSGTVVASESDQLLVGQKVLVTGFQMGMSHTGGYAQYARVPADWVVPLPTGLTSREAMVLGTAGFTAALSIQRLEQAGMTVAQQPRILVTGATGGVGSVALKILLKAGYRNVTALVHRDNQIQVAKQLGAPQVVTSTTQFASRKPLQSAAFDFIVDTVGGDTLAQALTQVAYAGWVSTCGNAGGAVLTTTVLPFILRGVNLLGIDSVNVPMKDRLPVWQKLATEWNVTGTVLVNEISPAELSETVRALREGTHLGRTLLRCQEV
ncbi:YhdH/YhfP family quinone oxidoreductase [Levilactobacillus bambusae]|uniref:NADPH:quinone reductase n=1 Tax=Levilactobacillus bambusae TaxID=2024736 RepID=A0A2V1MZG0_9LACO|nr:YhdH/YhfP family quinone oxidoreductase [Levilactobacillus bambusae]PWG00367.1 NADPH:quinone reductase [Levilactobacillus bambusae]